jgi:kumamolisin
LEITIMASKQHQVPLPGSERKPYRDAKILATADPNERLEVTVMVRRRKPLPSPATMGNQLPRQREYLTPEKLDSEYGADPADLKKVEAFAQQHGLQVVESSEGRRSVILSGTVAAFEKAFGVQLHIYQHAHGTYRGRTGPVHVPAELADIIEGVFGLDNRPFARPHFRRFQPHAASHAAFDPPQVAKLYNFPTGADGQGQCIGILELGGGFRPADLQKYFQRLGLPLPQVIPVSVDHAHNQPTGNSGGPDGEVVLDIEVAGAVAPGARIAVYFAPNDRSGKGFLDALSKAVHDTVNRPSVISISWGGPESDGSDNFTRQFNQILQSAAMLGITVCCAAGDNGAADMRPSEWDGAAHVDFPASSPFILACGGTRLEAAGSSIHRETVWNQHAIDQQNDSFGATGGGISQAFDVPSWQADLNLPPSVNGGGPGRGVPDVAGDADPATGYNVLVDGDFGPIGGTSAVAPLWAGLIALLNQKLGTRVGFINPLLYAKRDSGIFHDVSEGDNKVGDQGIGYTSGQGWDACTGLGTPNGAKLLQVLGG